jgi:hypothetical protein
MGESPVEVIEIDLALKGELMKEIKELDSDGCLWIKDSCRPPAKPEELGGDVDIQAFRTCTVINVNRMDAISMEDSGLDGGETRRRAGSTIMTKLDVLSKSLKRSLFEIKAIPFLVGRKEEVRLYKM